MNQEQPGRLAVLAERQKHLVAVGTAIARERWTRLPSTQEFADRLRADVEALENSAATEYWFAEKIPPSAEIACNRGRREKMISIITEIEAGHSGRLVEAALNAANAYEDDLRARQPMFYDGKPDYRAAGEKFADGLSAEAILVDTGTEIAVAEKTKTTRRK